MRSVSRSARAVTHDLLLSAQQPNSILHTTTSPSVSVSHQGRSSQQSVFVYSHSPQSQSKQTSPRLTCSRTRWPFLMNHSCWPYLALSLSVSR